MAHFIRVIDSMTIYYMEAHRAAVVDIVVGDERRANDEHIAGLSLSSG